MDSKERDSYIRARLAEHYNEAVSLGHEVFCVVLQGSQNYNLDIYSDTYKSDIDTKAILLPSFDEFCHGCSPISTTHVRSNNEHIDLKDIRVMFETFKKQNVNFVEILFSQYYIVPDKYASFWRQLRALGEKLTHCHPSQNIKTMAGLSFEKRKALCHPYPTIKDKIDKYGYDGKQLHHIVRINEFLKNYIAGIPFKKCLTQHDFATLELMVNAKLNAFSLDEALKLADQFNDETDALKNKFIEEHGTACDSKPYEELDKIKVKILRQWFKEQLAL